MLLESEEIFSFTASVFQWQCMLRRLLRVGTGGQTR